MTVDLVADTTNAPAPEERGAPAVTWRRALYLAKERAVRWAQSDLERLSLWSPVAIGAGVGVYFSLKTEPAWIVGVGVFALACALATAVGHRWRQIAVAAALAALGFVAADWRAHSVAAPQLSRDIGIVELTGRIVSLEESASRRRFVIALQSVEGLSADETPARARVTWRGRDFDAAPGDLVTLSAGLGPPPSPAVPGGFDFARQLYFQQIGAVGYAVRAPVVDADAPKTRGQRIAAGIEAMRLDIFRRITGAAPGDGGAIVGAVVTGKREAISAQAEAALRDAGLAHLLAISGLHMGLATGLIFFAVRFALALIEPIALRYPIKKWAAAAALMSGLFYLILSGGGWSARRAFIMTAIVFIAILADRRALSLRNVAVAAVIILLTTPEALFQPGFQMSFAAVTALIAGYEWASARADPHRSFDWPARLKRYGVGLAMTDLIAAVATAPYALYHFNRAALYSLPANVAAMPLMGFWIVPAAVGALLLAPLGLDGWAWRLSAAGMEVVLAIATEVSSWRGAVSVTPQWPLSALLALTFGGLWLCLARAPWRLAGLAALPAAVILIANARPPTLFVASSGLNAGIVLNHEDVREIAVFSTRRDRFAATVWTEAAGLDPMRAPPIGMEDVFSCDAVGCAGAPFYGLSVSFIRSRAALDEDCARADLVVAFFPASGADWSACRAVLIDRRSVWREGAHAVWIEADGAVRIETAKDNRGQRPWTGD